MAVLSVVYTHVWIPYRLFINIQRTVFVCLLVGAQSAGILYALYDYINWSSSDKIYGRTMENVIVPGWVWGLFSVVIVSWLIRLTFMAFKAEKDVSLSNSRDERILNDISHLDNKLDETKRDFHSSLGRLESKFERLGGKMDEIFKEIRNATK